MELLAQRRYQGMVLPLECFLRILRYLPTGSLAPERMYAIVRNMPALDCAEVDEAYWRQVVTQGTDTPISAPYAVLLQQVRAQKKVMTMYARKTHGEGRLMTSSPVRAHVGAGRLARAP